MARITREGFEACMAFGAASLAVAEVVEMFADSRPSVRARELLTELESAHHRLRDLFADGQDDAMHALPLSIVVLADRTTGWLEETEDRPGV